MVPSARRGQLDEIGGGRWRCCVGLPEVPGPPAKSPGIEVSASRELRGGQLGITPVADQGLPLGAGASRLRPRPRNATESAADFYPWLAGRVRDVHVAPTLVEPAAPWGDYRKLERFRRTVRSSCTHAAAFSGDSQAEAGTRSVLTPSR